jgi:anti-sigma-K factor RskA
LAAAAAIVVALAAFGAGVALRPTPAPTMAEQIMAAPDVRTVSADVAGGKATVMFSRDRNAGVLVMNNVPPPSQGTVYQMWLVGDKGPVSAGTMDTAEVTPSTTHMFNDLKNSSALAFTVEPPGGSPQPTGKIFAKLSLT